MLLGLLVCWASVGPDRSAAASAAPLEVRATRIDGSPPRIDGRLDEAVWERCSFATGLTQKDPDEGEPATRETSFGFLYDDDALYVAARMSMQKGEEIRASVSRRDNVGNSERFIVSLDTYRDRRTAYSFAVTATGVRADYYHPRDNEMSRDYSFDPVWSARAGVGSGEWSAELRIPFSQLRFNAAGEQRWGVNVNRWTPTTNEDAYWQLVPKDETGWSSRFPVLTGISGIPPSRRIEIMPYGVVSATSNKGALPLQDADALARAGADFKMGLGPNLTLDATINPDFGQVEADAAEVNLSAYETVFPEKRPFFIEGSQLLSGPGPRYFYTRRIGGPPHGQPADSVVAGVDFTTIRGALKLTGRTEKGLSVGALAAVTGPEQATVMESGAERSSKSYVEPASFYGVGRLQQEFGRSRSTVGLMLAGVERDLRSGSNLAGQMARRSIVGGGDWGLRFEGGKYEFSGHAGFSFVEGDSATIGAIQESSAHYFNRPDADHVDYRGARTSLQGYVLGADLQKLGGRHWLAGVGGSMQTPDFELNETGLLTSADRIDGRTWLRYRENRPGPLLRSYSLTLESKGIWNFARTAQQAEHTLQADAVWPNFVACNLALQGSPAWLSDSITRGGPLMRAGARGGFRLLVHGNYAAQTTWTLSTKWGATEYGSWSGNLHGRLGLRPRPRWELSLKPIFDRSLDKRQFIAALPVGGAETYGTSYVFSTVDFTRISVQARVNYSFTPDLTLEVYTEPFVASADFFGVGALETAGGRALRELSALERSLIPEQLDFTHLSFRSNFVLRWEWHPGSTLYLLWQQDRGEDQLGGERVGPTDILSTPTAAGDTYIGAKLTYWLPAS